MVSFEFFAFSLRDSRLRGNDCLLEFSNTIGIKANFWGRNLLI